MGVRNSKLNPLNWFGKKSQVVPFVYMPEMSSHFQYTNHTSIPFNGEVNPGNAGPMIEYTADHVGLAIRSWQSLFESDLAQIAIKRLVRWIIGKGLKLQSEPMVEILAEEGIKLDKRKFTQMVEARHALYRKSKSVDWAGEQTPDQLSKESEKNAIVGGDILVVLRVVNGEMKVQHIDSQHVQSPYYGSEGYPQELADGHLIIDGVELNAQRQHVAYYVKVYAVEAKAENINQPYRFERIEAYFENGMRKAYLYNVGKHRINNMRGLPMLAGVHEKLAGVQRYSSAALKNAEEIAKVNYMLVTDKDSEVIVPWSKNTAQAINGGGAGNGTMAETSDGVQKQKNIKVTNIGDVYALAPGSKIEALKNENPLYFKEFYETHADAFFAVLEIPPNVAMGRYDDSFSASRMASGDWGHLLSCKVDDHYIGYQKPQFDLWLHLEIMHKRIQAPGYILAYNSGNKTVLEAYRNVRMVGVTVPAVDSLKEARAMRELLGESMKHIPLIDGDLATEQLGTGDINEIIERAAEQKKITESAGIKPVEKLSVPPVAPGEKKPAKKKKPK